MKYRDKDSSAIVFFLVTIFSLLPQFAWANKIGVGLGSAAEYSGSSDSQVIPLAAFEYETRIGIFSNNQVGVKLDLIKSESFDTGPIIRANAGRDNSVSDAAVAALPEIEATAEAGWFVGSGFRLKALGLSSDAIVIGQLNIATDVGDGHGGTIINGSVGVVMQITPELRLIPSVSLNYIDDNYAQSFYGVSADNASVELSAFNASGGIESTQAALVGIRTIDERWSVTGTAAYNILRGDAADSPITERGSDRNVFAGVIINYHF